MSLEHDAINALKHMSSSVDRATFISLHVFKKTPECLSTRSVSGLQESVIIPKLVVVVVVVHVDGARSCHGFPT
jgi:hypothetical protein